MRFTVKGTVAGRSAEVTWDDGELTGDSYVIQLLILHAKTTRRQQVGPIDMPLAPETVPDYLRSPYRILFLAINGGGGLPPVFDTGARQQGDWPDAQIGPPDSIY